MGNSDNVIGYIEYLSDDGKIVGYVTPFTDVDRFKKEILEAAEVGMPITPVVFPDKMDKPLGLPRDIYWPGGFRKEKRQTYPYEIYQTNNRDFVFRNYAIPKVTTADRKKDPTRRQSGDSLLTRGKNPLDIDPRPSVRATIMALKSAARTAAQAQEKVQDITAKEER